MASFFRYYKQLAKNFFIEWYRAWRVEVFSTLALAIIIFYLARHQDASAGTTLWTTAKACGIWIVLFGAYHLVRTPWKRDQDREKDIATLETGKDKAESDYAALFAGPKFSGHFYQWQIFPRTGAVDPEFLNQVTNVAHQRDPLDKSDPFKCDYDIFVEMYIQNEAPGRSTILEYVLEMEFDGKWVKLEREFSFKGWILEREESQMNAKDFLKIVKNTVTKKILDLSDAASNSLEKDKGVEGWLHFVLRDIAYTEFGGAKKHDMRFIVNDTKSASHPIDRAWTGEPRPWKVAHDFS